MRVYFLLCVIAQLLSSIAFLCCNGEISTATDYNRRNLLQKSKNIESSDVLGFSKTDTNLPERSLAMEEAFKLIQSIIHSIIEKLREIQHKMDTLTQPITQYFRFEKSGKPNDHIDCDIETLSLTDRKLKIVYNILSKAILQDKQLHKRSNSTHLNINSHLIYRYLCANDWSKKYNGRSFEEAIADTVEWREQFGIASIDTLRITHLVKNGLGYTGGFDKLGRAIVYVKIGRNVKLESNDLYQKLLMYTVERADRMSVEQGCGEFVTVIDLEGFKWSTSIPIQMIKDAVTLLKKHYPYRLGSVFIINGSSTFTLLWNMIRPIMPRKVLGKTFVINKKDIAKVMCDKLGKENIEEAYGGIIKEDHSDTAKYFAQGYWGRHGRI
mmetsp:Transcript_21112/g.20452  ORF Transcript_21112/g.20452 Transcript_21112/m.20452 type:complete len:382 (+) Transcript_21112:106-1251(+)